MGNLSWTWKSLSLELGFWSVFTKTIAKSSSPKSYLWENMAPQHTILVNIGKVFLQCLRPKRFPNFYICSRRHLGIRSFWTPCSWTVAKTRLWIMDSLVMDLFGLWRGNTWFKVWDIRAATASIPISALKFDFGVERVTFILRELWA